MDILVKRSIELAKMMCAQNRYAEAEKILKDNLLNAEAKYLMGKICIKKGQQEEAKIWFTRAIETRYKWVSPRLALARIFSDEGSLKEAEREYNICMNREPKDAELKLEVARFYISKGDNETAKRLLEKAIKLRPNNIKFMKKTLDVYDKMQEYDKMYSICEYLRENNEIKADENRMLEIMARTYFSFGEYDKVLDTFKGKTKDSTNRIIANLYKRRIYSVLSKDEKQAKMYQTILSNLEEAYGEESCLKHIEKHLKDNKEKELHGVFIKSLPEIMEKIKIENKVKQKGIDCDIYCIEIQGCGYQGGNKGDGHTLDYVTLITMPDTHKPITIFPSDEIRINDFNKTKVMQKEEEFER